MPQLLLKFTINTAKQWSEIATAGAQPPLQLRYALFLIQKGLQTHESPLLLHYLAIRVDFAASAEDFTILEFPLKDSGIDEVDFASAVHFSVSHFALVAGPYFGGAGFVARV